MTDSANSSDPSGEAAKLAHAAWNEALAGIAGGFAHDANNCLTGIFSMSDLCLAQVDSEHPLHESLVLIRESANQASQLLQKLARLTYDAPGTQTYHDLNEIAAEAIEVARRALTRNVELVAELHLEQLPVFVDAVELRQVIIYLVLSAAVTLGHRGQVQVGSGLANQRVVITVRKCGQSLDGAASDDVSARRLHVANAFAERHSGTLKLQSKEGGDMTLQLSLPKANLTSDADPPSENSPKSG